MITRAADHLESDPRFRRWCKILRGPDDIDLSKTNGYCLSTEFSRWGDEVSLGAEEFLVCAAEVGSRNNHGYHYAFVEGGETANLVDAKRRSGYLQAAMEGKLITEQQFCQAENSKFFSMALYASLRWQGHERPELYSREDILRAEREHLVARLAEIDAELAKGGAA